MSSSNQNKPWLIPVIIGAHVLLLLSFSLSTTRSKQPPPQPIKVVTTRIIESVPSLSISSSPPAPTPKQTKVISKEVPAPKKPTPAKKVKKVVPVQKEVPPKPPTPTQPSVEKKQKKEELISLLETTLTQSKTNTSQSPHLGENKNITLKSEGLAQSTTTFEDELVIYLQNQLKMPYPGKIQLVLLLSAEGKLLEMEIKECKEKENKTYLEKTLPTVHYPSFASYFPKEKSRRVTLTLYINGSL